MGRPSLTIHQTLLESLPVGTLLGSSTYLDLVVTHQNPVRLWFYIRGGIKYLDDGWDPYSPDREHWDKKTETFTFTDVLISDKLLPYLNVCIEEDLWE